MVPEMSNPLLIGLSIVVSVLRSAMPPNLLALPGALESEACADHWGLGSFTKNGRSSLGLRKLTKLER